MTKREINNQRYLLIIGVLLLVVAMLYLLRSVLLPFVVGIVVAYFLNPLVNKITCNKISRNTATALVMGLFLLLLLPFLVLLGSMTVHQIGEFVSNLPQYANSFALKIKDYVQNLQTYFPNLLDKNWEEMWQGNIGESLKPLGKIFQKVVVNGFAFINVISLLLISPVVAFYMLRDWQSFTGKIYDLIPHKHKQNVIDGVAAIDRIISGYLRGQVMVCVALGSFYAFGLWLVGLDLGLLVGFIAGIISFIPYVGSISGFLMAMVLVVTQYGTMTKIAAVVAVFLIGQFLEGNFLTPKLVGENIGLHPVWVMFALLAGGVLLGLLGMIIAVPFAACVGVLLRYLIAQYKNSRLYLDE